MRDLAHRLVTYEAVAVQTSEPIESPAVRVYEKLRKTLIAFTGLAAFQSLASRALTKARAETPGLRAVRVAEDGSLQSRGGFEPQIEMDNGLAGEFLVGDGGIILIACLLGLLVLFIGAVATLSLLRVAWPSAAFDDRIFENGRKA
jgi:hypothetical protein